MNIWIHIYMNIYVYESIYSIYVIYDIYMYMNIYMIYDIYIYEYMGHPQNLCFLVNWYYSGLRSSPKSHKPCINSASFPTTCYCLTSPMSDNQISGMSKCCLLLFLGL